ncbi:MAG: universal stress protein, partial [Deltaproteobacteria bacterium]|nr:universal stress protein [Deltaproteobacteria bacterium]
MMKLLLFLQKNLVWSIPISMMFGLLYGYWFDAGPLKQYIIPVTFVMVYPMMVTLNIKSIFKGEDYKLQITTQVINFIVIPAIAYFIGNKEAAIKMVIFGLIIGALAAPIYTKVFMGATIEVNMLHMFKQIALFVFVPLIAGLATQSILKKKYSDILIILAPLTVFYLISYVMLSIVGKLFFQRGNAVAMVYGVVMRDLSIALAIAMTAFGKQGITIALLIALAYVIQIQTAAWYVKLVDRIFGGTMKKVDAVKTPEIAPALVVDDKMPEPLPVESYAMVPDIKRILYATDLSDTARHAVRYACSIGHQYNAKVTLLHVIPDIVEEISMGTGVNLADHMGKKEWESFNKNGIEAAKIAIHNRIKETSRRVTREIPQCPLNEENVEVRVGNPVEQILYTTRKGNYDLIIMGTHGHG